MRSRILDRTRVTPQNPPVEEPVISEARLNARNKASALAFSNMERPKETVNETATSPSVTAQSQFKDELGWLKPGVSVSGAKDALTSRYGYTSGQADELLKGRGITEEAARKAGQSKILARKERQAKIDARSKKEFEADVMTNPPKDIPGFEGSLLNSAYQSLRDPGGIRRRTYQRLTQNQR